MLLPGEMIRCFSAVVSCAVGVYWQALAVASDPDPATSMAGFCRELPRPAYAALQRLPSPDPWFELYRVAPGVTAIYEPFQWQEVISYLIEGSERALLFDTGNGIGDIASVVAALTSRPVAVMNSHTHFDHVGGNYSFTTIYGMDTDFTRDRQRGHSNRELAAEVSAAALCRPLPAGVTPQNHLGRPFEVTRFIDNGHLFDLGGRELEVIHIPGHTPDAIALLDRAHGLLWTGDSFYLGPIWLFAPETDLAAYARSLQILVALVPELTAVLPAHNTPWVQPDLLAAAATGFQRMLAGDAEAVDQGEGMVEYRPRGVSGFSFLLRAGNLR